MHRFQRSIVSLGIARQSDLGRARWTRAYAITSSIFNLLSGVRFFVSDSQREIDIPLAETAGVEITASARFFFFCFLFLFSCDLPP